MTSANTASVKLTATMTKPKNPSGLRVASWTTRSMGQGRVVRMRRVGMASGWAMLMDIEASAIANTRIERAIERVGDQIDQHRGAGE